MSATNPSTVGIRTVAPSTTGLQSGKQYTPRTQRAAKSTNEQLKSAIGDWLKSAYAASRSLDEGLKTLADANGSGNEALAEIYEQLCAALLEQLVALIHSGKDLVEQVGQVQGEQSADATVGQPDAEGVVETNSGAVPHEDGSAGALDAAAMDAGARAVLDHVAANRGRSEPGSVTNPFIVDAARIEATRKRAGEVLVARNPERVRVGMHDEPLTSYDQLSFMQPAAK